MAKSSTKITVVKDDKKFALSSDVQVAAFKQAGFKVQGEKAEKKVETKAE